MKTTSHYFHRYQTSSRPSTTQMDCIRRAILATVMRARKNTKSFRKSLSLLNKPANTFPTPTPTSFLLLPNINLNTNEKSRSFMSSFPIKLTMIKRSHVKKMISRWGLTTFLDLIKRLRSKNSKIFIANFTCNSPVVISPAVEVHNAKYKFLNKGGQFFHKMFPDSLKNNLKSNKSKVNRPKTFHWAGFLTKCSKPKMKTICKVDKVYYENKGRK